MIYIILYHTFISESFFGFETCTDPYHFVFNFYQINKDDKIRTRDRLIIKILISYQKTILIYYSLIIYDMKIGITAPGLNILAASFSRRCVNYSIICLAHMFQQS